MKENYKLFLIVGISLLLSMLLLPFISGIIDSYFRDSSKGNKRVTCETTVRNPTYTDNYNFERISCTSKPSVVCELPLSISTLGFFRSNDQVTIEISSVGVPSKRLSVTIDESINPASSGNLQDITMNYCIPKENNKINLRILDNKNQQTDSREVIV